ncbi:MAG TPA: hypothetical protein VFI48_11465 [Hyphomicrobiaceae bacterium]|nr:hypothetical protein [Hyphomicrobiaceae bacterium]
MTLEQYRKIATKIETALAAALMDNGLKMSRVRASIDSFAGTVRLTIEAADTALKDKDGNATTPEAVHWVTYGRMYDLKPEWLGQTYKAGSAVYTIAGLRVGRSRKNVVLKRADGRTFVTTAEDVRRHLGAKTN